MAANFNLFAEIAQTNFGSTSLILLKPTGLHPNGHTGGVLVQPDSAEYAALEHFVDLLNGDKDPCDPIGESASCDEVQPGPRQLRRLTRFEYDRTISEIFGFESTYGSAFTPEVVVHAFDNNGSAVTVDSLFADQVRKAASAAEIASILNAQGCPQGEGVCGRLLDTLGLQIFGDRGIGKAIRGFMMWCPPGRESKFQWVLTGLLQSPHFLYRAELGEHLGEGVYALDSYEIASQLSYLVWGSMPDSELFAAAASGELLDPEVREEQLQRLLADPKSRGQLAHFSNQWLEVNQLATVPRREFTPTSPRRFGRIWQRN